MLSNLGLYFTENYNILILFIVTNLILIYFFSFLAVKIKLLDVPDQRKRHTGSIPLIGGLVIYTSIILFYFFLNLPYWISVIFISSSMILIIGLIDDKFQIGVIIRLIAQLVACLLVIGSGIQIVDVGSYLLFNNLHLGIYGIFFTILCVIGITNAINFIDGIDGLSAGIGLTCLISILCFSYFDHNIQDTDILIFFIITLFIFLIANLNYFLPKIFLGDSGSMLIGFLIGWLLIYFTHPDIRYFHPVLTLWAVTVPTFDLLSVFTRRIIKKINPFKPDRRHIHHLLISIGFSDRLTLIILILFSILNSFVGYITYAYLGSFVSLILFFIFFIFYLISSILLGRKYQKIN